MKFFTATRNQGLLNTYVVTNSLRVSLLSSIFHVTLGLEFVTLRHAMCSTSQTGKVAALVHNGAYADSFLLSAIIGTQGMMQLQFFQPRM